MEKFTDAEAAEMERLKWVDLRKRKPAKGIRVLVCDDNGYVTIENVDDVMNVHVGKMTWLQSWKFGNGTRLRYWMPLPKVPADIEGDGDMPSWRCESSSPATPESPRRAQTEESNG